MDHGNTMKDFSDALDFGLDIKNRRAMFYQAGMVFMRLESLYSRECILAVPYGDTIERRLKQIFFKEIERFSLQKSIMSETLLQQIEDILLHTCGTDHTDPIIILENRIEYRPSPFSDEKEQEESKKMTQFLLNLYLQLQNGEGVRSAQMFVQNFLGLSGPRH